MLRDAVADFPGQIQSAAVVLEHVDDAKALNVVIEAAGHQLVDDLLAGVPERSVPEVVAERDGFGQLFVKLQNLRDGARDLRHLQRVRQPGAIVVPGRRKEHLRLVLEPPEGLAVDDAVAVPLKRRTYIVFGFGTQASARIGALRGLRRQDVALTLFELLSDGHDHAEAEPESYSVYREFCVLRRDLGQEARTVGERPDAEDVCEGLRKIREG